MLRRSPADLPVGVQSPNLPPTRFPSSNSYHSGNDVDRFCDVGKVPQPLPSHKEACFLGTRVDFGRERDPTARCPILPSFARVENG